MTDLLRETAAGYIIRLITGRRVLHYPEEIEGFDFPSSLQQAVDEAKTNTVKPSSDSTAASDIEKAVSDSEDVNSGNKNAADGIILVEWYSEDDPANPQNWSTSKKVLVTFEICIYTFTVYLGSAIYAPSIGGVMEDFNCSELVASLGLALYVLSYGLGALLWSPLSEIPLLGRNSIYISTFFIFTVLLIPTAMVNNLAGLLVLRFLLGWFGSPCLATGAAGFSDIFSLLKLPYCLAFWACSATLAPALGPIIAGYAIPAKDWHWSMWEELWLSSVIFVFLFFLLPETSTDNILLRRASRLRQLTGNKNFRSQSEINQEHMSAKEMAFDALIKPWEMNVLDPAILYTTFYAALCYAIFYSFFESFPLVFPPMYGFTLGEMGIAYLAVPVGVMLAVPIGLLHYGYFVEPGLVKNGIPEPEVWLRPGLIANFLVPGGLFIFAWTARSDVHWIVPLIGLALTQSGSYIILNVLFTYIPNIYPKYAASLFAANDAARSTLAAAAIVFGRPMFLAMGVAGGTSFLAGLSCICSVLFFVLYRYGPVLRKRSKFVGT